MLFVEGCIILYTPFLTLQKLKQGHEKLISFLRSFKSLYVSMAVVSNSQLIECIIDYGPIHSFWLYSLKLLNGVLGSIHTNRRLVEIQLMRKMLQCQTIEMFDKPELYSDIFVPVFRFETSKTINNYKADDVLQLLALSPNVIITNMAWLQSFDISFIGSRQNVHLTDHKVEHLSQSLQMFSNVDPLCVSGSCYTYKSIDMDFLIRNMAAVKVDYPYPLWYKHLATAVIVPR